MTPRGWYDIGGGMAGMWDGQQWTGERITHQQLAAMTRPPAPPPPTPGYQPMPMAAPRRRIHPVGWLVLIVLFIFIGLPLIAAFMQGFTTGLGR